MCTPFTQLCGVWCVHGVCVFLLSVCDYGGWSARIFICTLQSCTFCGCWYSRSPPWMADSLSPLSPFLLTAGGSRLWPGCLRTTVVTSLHLRLTAAHNSPSLSSTFNNLPRSAPVAATFSHVARSRMPFSRVLVARSRPSLCTQYGLGVGSLESRDVRWLGPRIL